MYHGRSQDGHWSQTTALAEDGQTVARLILQTNRQSNVTTATYLFRRRVFPDNQKMTKQNTTYTVSTEGETEKTCPKYILSL